MIITKEAIVAEARSWMDTPFRHQARVKGVGVDCVGLLVGVARSLGLKEAGFDVGGYPRVPDGQSFMHLIAQHLDPITFEEARVGDICCVAIGEDPQHVGILGPYRDGFSLIHSSSGSGKVVEQRLLFTKTLKFVAMFRFQGV